MSTKSAEQAPTIPVRKQKRAGERELTEQDIRDAARGAQDALEFFNKHGKLPVNK